MTAAQGGGERAEYLGLLAARALHGDEKALEHLLAQVRDDVYRLALRMTGHPLDAEDATQEVLVKVLTNLSGWRGEARITTWIHRVTVNHLLDRRRSRIEHASMSFEDFGADLVEGLADPKGDPVEQVLLTEVQRGCTLAMLRCLDRDHRIAYIIGELFEIPGEDAAWICGIGHDTYRKRLSRARERVRAFMVTYCGLVGPTAECSCARRGPRAIALGRVDHAALVLADHPTSRQGELLRRADELQNEANQLRDAASVLRDHPDYSTRADLNREFKRLLEESALLSPDP